jgi:uncharacterized protein (TIGR01777 family)
VSRFKFAHSFSLKNFSPPEVFGWHNTERSLARLLPPWHSIRIVEAARPTDGSRVKLRASFGPISQEIVAEHFNCKSSQLEPEFSDRIVSGPLPYWEHQHRFVDAGPDHTTCEDLIEYELPGGLAPFQGMFEKEIARSFRFREEMLLGELIRWQRYFRGSTRTFAITGSSGFVGNALFDSFTAAGQSVQRVVRNVVDRRDRDILWKPESGEIEIPGETPEIFVHMAGESILGRWTASQKEHIRSSRVDATKRLCESILKLPQKPKTFISASAIGFYGERGDEPLNEESPRGSGFLAEVVSGWEEATRPLQEAGIRVVNLRIGTILNPRGGALAQMVTPFKLCLGGKLGSGRQYVSWISLDDLISIVAMAACDDRLSGIVNAVAPAAVRNSDFTAALAKALHRPAFVPTPESALRLIFGEFATEALLPSTRVIPERLSKHGFSFAYGDLDSALRFMLGMTK